MKFIHTADLHLDSPLRGLAAYPDAPAERLRTATRDAFERLVNTALDEAVDFMVIAGDIYDGDWKDFNTGLFFIRQMGRLHRAGIPVFLLHGNHDAESDMTRTLQLPDNVRVFSSRKPESFRIDALKVALHGQSFRVKATTDNLVPHYPDPVAGWLNIGVLHTALEGNSQHASYAPCSVAELLARGYQYWALGHVHEHAILPDGKHQPGQPVIAYPGNIQGRHIRETGARGAWLVSAEGNEITDIQRLEVDVLRWARLEVSLADTDDMPAALRKAAQALEALLASTPSGLPLAVRVVFSGATAADQPLRAEREQLRQEVIAQAVALDPDRLWIEKVQVQTESLAISAHAHDEALQGTFAEIPALAQEAVRDEDFIRRLIDSWRPLLEKLPADVREASPELAALRRALTAWDGHTPGPDTESRADARSLIADRVQQAVPLLMSRLHAQHTTRH